MTNTNVRHREIIYQHLLRQGLPQIPQERIQEVRRRHLIDHYTRRKMVAYLERDAERLRTYYETNLMRFASPVRVHIRRLAVTSTDQAPSVMARLEGARQDLDAGRLELATLSEELGGTVRDLGMVNASQIKAVDPTTLRFAFLLKPGEHSPPYQAADSLVLFRVEARQEPAPRPLALVREQVVKDYLNHSAAAVFRDLSQELLAQAGFQLHSERLAQIGPLVDDSS